MSFKKDGYTIIKKAIDSKIANFIYKYLLLKREVSKKLFESRYISPFEEMFGIWNDQQVPGTFSCYADIATEQLLLDVKSIMEKTTGLKLNENYSYARVYKKGDILHRHKDRFSCEISTTLNLGGDDWPIFISKNKKEGFYNKKGDYVASNGKGIKVSLKPGDMLVYKGVMLEHWREPFEGKDCAQVFLHYNQKTKKSDKNLYDSRPGLGLPSWFKQ